MKDVFVDMRDIPIEIRGEVGFLILHRVRGNEERTILHVVSDLLYLPASENTDGIAEWYCFDGNGNIRDGIPVVGIHDLFEYGGPKPEYRPYRTLEEANAAVGRKVVSTASKELFLIIGAKEHSVDDVVFLVSDTSRTANHLFEYYTFDDGTPVGVLA